MRTTLLVFSFILMFFGLSVGFVGLNPFGFVLQGIGFVIFLYALFSKGEENRAYQSKQQYLRNVHEEDYKCGNCWLFGKRGCRRKEKLLNAEPCEDYIHTHTARRVEKEKVKIWPFTPEEIEELERTRETLDERKWQLEEVLKRHNLLDKVQKHEDIFSCGLCGKPFRDGDSRNEDIGKPIHSSCLIALLRRSSHE